MNDPSEPIPVQPLSQPVRLEYGTEGPVRLTTVGSYADAFEAHLARTKLEAEGVAAIVDGENVALAGVYGVGVPPMTDGAVVHAAMILAARPAFAGRLVVAVLPDRAEHYLEHRALRAETR